MNPPLLRFTIDTSVIVSAFRSSAGYSFDLVALIDQHRFHTLVTPALFLEYEQVLKRPEQVTIHRLSSEQIDRALNDLLFDLYPVKVVRSVRGEAFDPNDDLVLETAVNGFADAIVTYNFKHLQLPAARRGIRVLSPADIFKEGLLP